MAELTIVTITRNDLSGLRRTVGSLSAQHRRIGIEHVIVDGASTDGSAEWMRANAVFTETSVISEPDRGIYDAMNKGLGFASGTIVYFLNSGDCLAAPDVLDLVVQSHIEIGWYWAFGPCQMVDEAFAPVRVLPKAHYGWVRQTFWRYDISHQGVFMSLALARQFGGFDLAYPIAADYHLLTKVGRRLAPTALPFTIALTLEGGVSDRRFRATHWEYHRSRVETLDLSRPVAVVDACWTGFLIVKARSRRTLRTMIRAFQRGRPR